MYINYSDLFKLADVFVKYDYFNDDPADMSAYGILLDIYSSLPEECKLFIRDFYFRVKKSDH